MRGGGGGGGGGGGKKSSVKLTMEGDPSNNKELRTCTSLQISHCI